jgi:hypothetical protein
MSKYLFLFATVLVLSIGLSEAKFDPSIFKRLAEKSLEKHVESGPVV